MHLTMCFLLTGDNARILVVVRMMNVKFSLRLRVYNCLIQSVFNTDVFLCSHSDLALRNCYLTADLTVKVGDYGIGPYRYKVSRKFSFIYYLVVTLLHEDTVH